MTPALALLALVGSVLRLPSDGSGFFELPDTAWVAPGSSYAVLGEDTIQVGTGFSGSRVGFILERPPPAGDTVSFVYSGLPLSVRNSSSLSVDVLERIQSGTSIGSPTAAPPGGGLYISGAKRLGLSVGDGGGVSQSTRLSVDGQLVEGISVTGSVTDENLPLGAGSSELVSELDKVLFTVRGSRWRARLGDMEWTREEDRPGPLSWRREASGIDFTATPVDTAGGAIGYGTTGESHNRTVFFTQEGVQGPYEVSGQGNIVPGGEVVYLDGELMRKGVTRDYTMDYSAGLITFTSRRLIRRDQRVEVTFFERGDGYRKDLLSGSTSASWDVLSIEVCALSDRDDRDDPLGFVLTEEGREVLEGCGECSDSAWVDGAEYVGEGNGSYTVDSLGHYAYQGPEGGDWSVTFSRPPDAPGDYVYDSSVGGFAWAGSGLGTHLPRRYLQIPSGTDVGGVSLRGTIGESVGYDVQTAVSRHTGNLFASDFTSREGSCTDVALDYSPWEDTYVGFDGRLSSDGFTAPGRLDADSTLSEWSLPPGYRGNDRIAEFSAGTGPLGARLGARQMQSGGHIRRAFLSAVPARGTTLRARLVQREDTDSLESGSRAALSAEATLTSGLLSPTVGAGLTRESWGDSLSGDLVSVGTGLSLTRGSSRESIRLEAESDARVGGIPRPDRVWRATLSSLERFGTWKVDSRLEHSLSTYDRGGSTQADALSIDFSGTSGGTWVQVMYSGSGMISRSLQVRYRYVGEGEGSYGYDPDTGQYYPDPDGSYEKYYQPGGAGERITDASLDASALHTGTDGGLDLGLRLTSSGEEDRLRILLLEGALNDDIPGGYELEAAPYWTWRGTLRKLSVRGRMERSTVDYSGTGRKVESSWKGTVSPRLAASEWLMVDGAMELWEERQELYEARRISGGRLEVDPFVTFQTGFEPGLLVALEHRSEDYRRLEATMWELRPHCSVSTGGWTGSGRFSVGLIPGSGELPPWFFDGSDRGVSLRMRFNVGRRLGSGLDVSVFYWGSRPAGSELTQRAGLEGTVSF
ncbi:hypothetical protein GF402_08740 [Candidatus Fermentibacteria bacterium]|nr:hypothetical protein [Candidatus Fermentibacteria bacterium]